ncbi:MAG: response regulator [Actinomycetota bacterium]|nr:response regulator [Actinomycetota bacterium]
MSHIPLVLTIDDEPEITSLISMALTLDGLEVAVANNVFEGMSAITEQMPDVILLDIMMPGIDGWLFCETLRRDEATRDIPIVFVSALRGAADKAKAASLGASGYVTKPFSIADLRSEVARHVRESRHQGLRATR